MTENKGWICLQPIVFEQAVGFFLASHHMEELAGECIASRKIESREEEPDFILGDAWIELNVPDAILNVRRAGGQHCHGKGMK